MKILSSTSLARQYAGGCVGQIVLVPTMGALHAGHGVLLAAAREWAGPTGKVVATIFVNPTQFGPKEDLARYPRTLDEDLKLCRREKVDAVFVPETSALYATDHSIMIRESALSTRLCGASRPGHFDGVCTIVAKLFGIFQPRAAIFGEKDWQQLAVLRRMVRDLNLNVEMVGYPTVREADGLALSSRNRYLSAAERELAPLIHGALQEATADYARGLPLPKIQTGLRRRLRRIPGARLDYAELVEAESLQPARHFDRPIQAMVALYLGAARLIDNHRLNPDCPIPSTPQ